MTRIGFIGRTKPLYDAIKLFSKLDGFKISVLYGPVGTKVTMNLKVKILKI